MMFIIRLRKREIKIMVDHYYIAGLGFNEEYFKKLKKVKTDFNFEVNVLYSQLRKSDITRAIEYRKEGIIDRIMIDSGAYSAYTRGVDIDIDEYTNYINSIEEDVDYVVALDVISDGTNFEETAEKSYNNFIYSEKRMKYPQKLIPTTHINESEKSFKRVLELCGNDVNFSNYIGIGGIAKKPQNLRDKFLTEIYNIINKMEDTENLKLHCFGMTDVNLIKKYDFYSVDSTSVAIQSVYNNVYHYNRDNNKMETVTLNITDKEKIKELDDRAREYGGTYNLLIENYREVVLYNIYNINCYLKENSYPAKKKSTKSLF